MRIHPSAYLSVFLLPAMLPLALWLGALTARPDLFAWLPLAMLYLVFPVLDHWLGRDASNLPPAGNWRGLPRAIAWACLPLQLAMLLGGAYVLLELRPFGWLGTLGWILSVGDIGGILAINVAHELIHKRSRTDQTLGGLLLALVCYAGFKVEHVRGHHVWVSTPRDPSTARLNQSLYHFLPRAIGRNFINAWRLEARRLVQQGLSPLHWRNELIWYYALSTTLLASLVGWGGWLGGLYFLGQGATAFIALEVINYIEHYGLRRRQLPNGHFERPAPQHSWNASQRFTNLVLLQLGRHSDHHAHASRPYPELQHHADVPQLPAGYPAMFVLAMVPPLWRRIMNPRAQRWRAAET